MALTPGLKLPIPESTETADGPDAFSDLANGVEDYVYDRILPAGVTRVPSHFWGQGTSLPTSADLRAGDTYRHTGLGCMLMYNSSAWRQAEVPTVSNLAAVKAISDSHASVLYTGFTAVSAAASTVCVWNGSKWTYELYGLLGGVTDGNGIVSFPHGGIGGAPIAWGVSKTNQDTEALNLVVSPMAFDKTTTHLVTRVTRTDSSAILQFDAARFSWWARW